MYSQLRKNIFRAEKTVSNPGCERILRFKKKLLKFNEVRFECNLIFYRKLTLGTEAYEGDEEEKTGGKEH